MLHDSVIGIVGNEMNINLNPPFYSCKNLSVLCSRQLSFQLVTVSPKEKGVAGAIRTLKGLERKLTQCTKP